MKHTALKFFLLVAVLLGASLVYGQGPSGAGVKKPRTIEDYKPSTLKEIFAGDSDDDKTRDKKTRTLADGELLPFRVRVVYTASTKPISETNNNTLNRWVQCCAGSPDHYKAFASEMRFDENGTAYWLVVQKSAIADFQKELRAGETVDLFLIRLRAGGTDDNWAAVLLVEKFQRAESNTDKMKESLDWIRTNLPSYTGKDLKVEMTTPCRLKISDTVNSVSVSKAVVFIPLDDLETSRVDVARLQGSSDSWQLDLHTATGKHSIRFMLYQGSPAEGGQANKYSLTFHDRQKADEMAEAFRRVIQLCSNEKNQVP